MSNASSDLERSESAPTPRPTALAWGPVSAIVVTVLAFFGAQLLAGIVLSLGLNEAKSNEIAGQFYFVVFSDALIVLTVWLFLHGRKAQLRQLGFMRHPMWRDIGFALLGYAVYFAALIIAFMAIGAFTNVNLNQKQELGFDHLFGSSEKIMAFFALVLLPPLVEETVFRGFVFTALRSKLPFIGSAIITSLLFAAPHLLASGQGLLWVAGVDTLLLSCVLCYLREKTGALWAPMMVHAIKNCIAFVLLLSSVASL